MKRLVNRAALIHHSRTRHTHTPNYGTKQLSLSRPPQESSRGMQLQLTQKEKRLEKYACVQHKHDLHLSIFRNCTSAFRLGPIPSCSSSRPLITEDMRQNALLQFRRGCTHSSRALASQLICSKSLFFAQFASEDSIKTGDTLLRVEKVTCRLECLSCQTNLRLSLESDGRFFKLWSAVNIQKDLKKQPINNWRGFKFHCHMRKHTSGRVQRAVIASEDCPGAGTPKR